MSRDIGLGLIDRDEAQPRHAFDDAALAELAQSMAADGLIVPIMVRPVGDRFVIVHGERRWRAAASLGWETIRAEVRDVSADDAHWLALIENVQRQDLSPIEEAHAYEARLAEGMTQTALAERIGKGQSYIAQKLRLLTLPDPVRLYLDRRAITEGHARQLLRLRAMHYDGWFSFGELPASWFDDAEIDGWCILSWALLEMYGIERVPANVCGREFSRWVEAALENIGPTDALLAEGCKRFFGFAHENGDRVPIWTIPAFVFAGITIAEHLSVSTLGSALTMYGASAWPVATALEATCRGAGVGTA